MSRQLASRNTHFSPAALPGPVMAIRAQTAGVEFNGVTALYSGMSPRERAIAEQAIADRRYGQRTLPGGMTCYVIQSGKPQAGSGKPTVSKRQRALAEQKLVADVAALAAAMPAAATPTKRRNRHEVRAARQQ